MYTYKSAFIMFLGCASAAQCHCHSLSLSFSYSYSEQIQLLNANVNQQLSGKPLCNNFVDNFEDNIEDNSGRINTHLTPFTAMCFVQITLGPYV